MEYKEIINRKMQEHALTGYALARGAKISLTNAYRIMAGENVNISTLDKVCKFLKIKITLE